MFFMLIKQLSAYFCNSVPAGELITKLDDGQDVSVSAPGFVRPFAIASLFIKNPRPICVVVSGQQAAMRFARSLSAYIGTSNVLLLAQQKALAWSQNPLDESDLALSATRAQAIGMLSSAKPVVVVTCTRALMKKIAPAGADIFSPITLCRGTGVFDNKTGELYTYEELIKRLVTIGYVRENSAESPGSFAVHGDSVDIYLCNEHMCVRAEFFGDDLDGLRQVLPVTGQTIRELDEVNIWPVQEFQVSKKGLERLHTEYDALATRRARIANDLQNFDSGIRFAGMERYLPALYRQLSSPLAHASANTLLVLCEPRSLFDDASRYYDELKSQAAAAKIKPSELESHYFSPANLDFGALQRLTVQSIMSAGSSVDVSLEAKRPSLQASDEKLLANARAQIKKGNITIFSAANKGVRQDFELLFSDNSLSFVECLNNEHHTSDYASNDEHPTSNEDSNNGEHHASDSAKDKAASGCGVRHGLEPGILNICDLDIESGFIIPAAKLAIFSVHDLSRHSSYGSAYGGANGSQLTYNTAGALDGSNYGDYNSAGGDPRFHAGKKIDITEVTFPFAPGDYVVHKTHGIALFKGLVKQEVGGYERDYMLLGYAQKDKLYVPIEQIGRITRYVGPDSSHPRLTRLNATDWTRAINKAKKSAKKLAFDLVDLYARRSTVKGVSYLPDNEWQKEMEDAFPFEETPDQLSAIADVKADMESERPMDRLICGDVGFGKTEVALRAAFKAISSNRQVMVLCPTTILAQQHFTTFSERFEPFGVCVEVLSRFRTSKQQKQALESFRNGTVDVLVGTHRLLSRDVNPKNLGLIIIDEEQRFGVGHKEKLKNMRESVDVLTLSATPIPRTLQMSLSGVRDMSLISTPPPGRLPVKVHVGEWDEDVVSAAIRFEVARGGQVYYVSNRVRTIDDACSRVTQAAPEARLGVAHGQMSAKQIEDIMEQFSAGELDVLVASTIVESGLDNPHTNTLIIEDSHRLGLAQLYQLKGRVGRSKEQAYAYFLFPKNKPLTEEATARLEAIGEFSELGSGMKVAMRDLEIRGAGTLLGAQQSGNMSAVGFDLFASMIAEAVSEASGQGTIAHMDVRVDIKADFFLPEEFIPETDKRVLYYRRIAAADDMRSVNKLAEEMQRDFGGMPKPARNMIVRARIKALAASCSIENIVQIGSNICISPIGAGLAEKLSKNAEVKKRLDEMHAKWSPRKKEYTVPISDKSAGGFSQGGGAAGADIAGGFSQGGGVSVGGGAAGADIAGGLGEARAGADNASDEAQESTPDALDIAYEFMELLIKAIDESE